MSGFTTPEVRLDPASIVMMESRDFVTLDAVPGRRGPVDPGDDEAARGGELGELVDRHDASDGSAVEKKGQTNLRLLLEAMDELAAHPLDADAIIPCSVKIADGAEHADRGELGSGGAQKKAVIVGMLLDEDGDLAFVACDVRSGVVRKLRNHGALSFGEAGRLAAGDGVRK